MTDKEINGTPGPAEIDMQVLQEILDDARDAFDTWVRAGHFNEDMSTRAVFYHGFLWGRISEEEVYADVYPETETL